jgi:hypothetical protein
MLEFAEFACQGYQFCLTVVKIVRPDFPFLVSEDYLILSFFGISL